MLPSILARQLETGISDYVNTTFPMTNEPFKGSVPKMLTRARAEVYREPYACVRMPYRVADTMPTCFTAVHMTFKPYVHQLQAFERLTGDDGRSTIIATGTGSGKTECFLYPILEYCYQHRNERGVKALIIYPMNALATDQAGRIAQAIFKSPELKNNVSVGLFVGGEEKRRSRQMTSTGVITDRDTILNAPPDILLTNYKMLDYLLVRPQDAKLWQENKPDTLKYIAVDELHTFDGAQGTDLACLLRRLKKRLDVEDGSLCCIGTSATMGSKDSTSSIRQYAEDIFGELFDSDAVVMEDRLSAGEFLYEQDITDFTIPTREQLEKLEQDIAQDEEETFLKDAVASWISGFTKDPLSDEGRIALSSALLHHSFFQALIRVMNGNYCQAGYLIRQLSGQFPFLQEVGSSLADTAVNSMLALISHARTGKKNHLRPFLNVQVQLWMRELRRLTAKVDGTQIRYSLWADLNEEQQSHYLPVVNCRDCGMTAWVGFADSSQTVRMRDIQTFYNQYFKGDDRVVMMYPDHWGDEVPKGMTQGLLCPSCLKVRYGVDQDLQDHSCMHCGEEMIPVLIPIRNKTTAGEHKQFMCPFCGSRRGLALMGMRSATEISADISQIFASKFNDDKKALAFSDNVQDAAQRAGFFNSRTWSFVLRTAIQEYVLHGGAGKSLNAFTKGFLDYWENQKGLSREDFVGLFIAPNMVWEKAYEDMKEKRKLGKDKYADRLVLDIRKRLAYQILLEYGMTANIGRTLTKSGCSGLYFDPADLQAIASRVQEHARAERPEIAHLPLSTYETMVLGFLDTMRRSGSFDDPVFGAMLDSNRFDSFLVSSGHLSWLPGRQSGRNTPSFLVEFKEGRRVENCDTFRDDKYTDWIRRCSDVVIPKEDDLYEQVAAWILAESVQQGVVKTYEKRADRTVYLLSKDKVFVTDKIQQLVCSSCGTITQAPVENAEAWINAPCIRRGCDGVQTRSERQNLDYYGKLYTNGNLIRIHAREHTGMLERDNRERLERDFKRSGTDRLAFDPNILSCTPTLEMGIDIGDLSTVILCSMPPGQSQFVQRTGRAGRRDGNAFSLVIAAAKPHDLYFYADPMEMINGIVEPPKIFLNASAVLERQLTAFCMDSWVKKGKAVVIPDKIQNCITNIEGKNRNIFPFNFLDYVEKNKNKRYNAFISMFPYLTQDTKDELRDFVQSENSSDTPKMATRFYDAFHAARQQQMTIQQNANDLQDLIHELEKQPKDQTTDEEIQEEKRELQALENTVRDIGKKDTFGFMCDEGLMPNYAFPEEGVVLKAILYRKDDDAGKDVEKMTFEYQRPASMAIHEFAPDNTFYANGRKLKIDQIDVRTAEPAAWRICPECSYMQLEDHVTNRAECPRCHSVHWADAGQVRTLLRVKMVYCNMPYNQNMISDDSDTRTIRYYQKELLVDVDENDITAAFEMDNKDFPFGYEYTRKAVIREINFGEKEGMKGHDMHVAGREEEAKGFKICRYCGKIIQKDDPYRSSDHASYCRTRKMHPMQRQNIIYDSLFLYRELSTEALRILIPATVMDPVSTQSFVAAFMLGLKEKFGNIDHLKATISEVPVPETNERKQYLVIYDTVPGGTGYLKQFVQAQALDPNKNLMTQILQLAYDVMDNCSCRDDENKDGCYHCLYAYRLMDNVGSISRRRAMQMIQSILSGRQNLKRIYHLGDIDANQIFDSELERNFIQAFRERTSEGRPIRVDTCMVHGKHGYRLIVGVKTWEIEPQVMLGPEDDVAVASKPDFVIRPLTNKNQLPVAVFTDGFRYHKDIAEKDTLKREAIRRSGRFVVWSLSYQDVQEVFTSREDPYPNSLAAGDMPYGSTMYRPIIGESEAAKLKPDRMSSFDLLIAYLTYDNAADMFARQARAYSLSLLTPQDMGNPLAFVDWEKNVEQIRRDTSLPDETYPQGQTLFGRWAPEGSDSLLTIYSGVPVQRMRADENASADVMAVLEDREDQRTEKYQGAWNSFWKFANVMQFQKNFIAVTQKGIANGDYRALPKILDQIPEEETEDAWDEIMAELKYSEDEARQSAEKIRALGVSAPDEVGHDFMVHGSVAATAEMIWLDAKVCYMTVEQLESRNIAEGLDFTVLDQNSSFSADLFTKEQ